LVIVVVVHLALRTRGVDVDVKLFYVGLGVLNKETKTRVLVKIRKKAADVYQEGPSARRKFQN
jgi:hypothetical protein